MKRLLLFILLSLNLFSSYEIKNGKVLYIPEPFVDNEIILEDIDLKNFKMFYDYAKDKNNIYYMVQLLEKADSKTFKIMEKRFKR